MAGASPVAGAGERCATTHGHNDKSEHKIEAQTVRESVNRDRQVIWLLCAAALFGMLAIAVHLRPVVNGDAAFLRGLHHGMHWRLSRTMLFANRLGNPFVVYPCAVALTIWQIAHRDWRGSAFVVLSMGGIALANVGLRAAFHRVRPDLWPSLLPNHSYIYSFPSGHASIIAGLALTLARVILLPRSWNIVLTGIVLAVGFTTLGLGVHFLTDVVAGWALAVVWTLTSGLIVNLDSRKP